ncbi:MAG: VWA domain-containing protein [Acidobacteriaceae bacterium]
MGETAVLRGVFQQHARRFWPLVALAVLLGASAMSPVKPGYSQTAAPGDNASHVFRANARIVVVDVVVTGKKHRPLTGLRQQDFLVSEDGTRQTIKNFEEHTTSQPTRVSPAEPTPNLFTNIPRGQQIDSVTVLVLDSLNTPLDDQRRVKAQVLKYLKKPQAGQKIAIFTLQTQLRLIQSFSDDPEVLAAAVNDKKNGVGKQVPQLLQSNGETAVAQETAAAMREAHGEDTAEALEKFMAGQASVRSEARLKITLQALQDLAHYLGGFAGRKNVVWFSGGFPLSIFPTPGLTDPFSAQRDDEQEVRKTDALLASAQMAIYPIGAAGVSTDSAYDAGADSRTTSSQLSRPQDSRQEENASHAAMDVIAKDTGGAAFYGTNDLADALNRVIAHGSNFYTLTYTSTNPASDGRFRKIEVKLGRSGYLLDYRRGYYVDNAKGPSAPSPLPTQSADMLSPFLRRGTPDSTEIPLTLRVVRGKIPPGASAVSPTSSQPRRSSAGDNPELTGAVARYAVDLMMPARGLQFETAANGHRYVRMEAGLLVFDREGRALNWLLRQVNLNLDDARYALVQTNGVNLYFEIDAPASAVFVRGGVYDRSSNLVGTVAVPLAAVVSSSVTTSSR